MTNEPILSICIPTYNRSQFLRQALASIASSEDLNFSEVEICVSDNHSTDATTDVVKEFSKDLKIKFFRQEKNLGFSMNYIKVVSMAIGEFVWVIGDDDLLLTDSISKVIKMIKSYKEVDFFYVNAFVALKEYTLNKEIYCRSEAESSLKLFSNINNSKIVPFHKLIHPRYSHDLLGGIYLAVYRRNKWNNEVRQLSAYDLYEKNQFANLQTTFPHLIVFAAAFSKSKSYYSSVPHIITHGGAREWAPSYPIVRTFRLLEALDVYRANSLPIFHYIVFKNILLKYFFLDIYFISKLPKLQTIDSPTTKELVSYFCYPYFYVSFLRLIYHLLKHRN
jgi:glycosyltransferase involved in cell wall biosynthesis